MVKIEMDKNKRFKIIGHFLDGKLSKGKEQELLLWIKSDERNRRLFLEEQELLSRQDINQKDRNLNLKWESFKQRIEKSSQKNQVRSVYIRVASIAAAFIFGILLTTVVFSKYFTPPPQSSQMLNVSTPYGARTNMRLPDGSLVWLNSGSTISYPSKFEKKRSVTLIGEAFFEVEKNGKPFVVSTIYGQVEVTGTTFNVKAYTEETLQATLVTGSVLFKEKVSQNEVTLLPGQQVNLVGGQLLVEEVETEFFTSWKYGKLIFRKVYLPEVAKRLERWYNVKIQLEDDKRLNEIWFNGTLEMESFTEVLELLKVTSSIDYVYNEKTRTIKIKYYQNN